MEEDKGIDGVVCHYTVVEHVNFHRYELTPTRLENMVHLIDGS